MTGHMSDERTRPDSRPASTSFTEMTHLVLPNDANTLGNVLGGRVMHWIDLAAAVAAHRFCGRTAVTASIDTLDFINPIRVGQVALLKAKVTWTGTTSMEVRVDVFSEDLDTQTIEPTSVAYLTFVALDDRRKPTKIPALLVESAEEKAEIQDAEERHLQRIMRRSRSRGTSSQA